MASRPLHGIGSYLRRQRARGLLRGSVVVMLILSVLAWALFGLSCVVEWSTFTASAPRARAPWASMLGAAPTPREERDETHYMFGHGRAVIYSNTVHTESFDAPHSDLNSHYLAWATFEPLFPHSRPLRWDRYPPGPLIGLSLWLPAAVFTALLIAVIVLYRRTVPPGHCPYCRYDLRGTADRTDLTVCPECGAARGE